VHQNEQKLSWNKVKVKRSFQWRMFPVINLSLAGFPLSLQACKQFQVKIVCYMMTRTQQNEILIIAIGLASFAASSVAPTSVQTSLNTNIFLLFSSSEEND